MLPPLGPNAGSATSKASSLHRVALVETLSLALWLVLYELGPVRRQHRRERGKAVEGRSRAERNERSGVERSGRVVEGVVKGGVEELETGSSM